MNNLGVWEHIVHVRVQFDVQPSGYIVHFPREIVFRVGLDFESEILI